MASVAVRRCVTRAPIWVRQAGALGAAARSVGQWELSASRIDASTWQLATTTQAAGPVLCRQFTSSTTTSFAASVAASPGDSPTIHAFHILLGSSWIPHLPGDTESTVKSALSKGSPSDPEEKAIYDKLKATYDSAVASAKFAERISLLTVAIESREGELSKELGEAAEEALDRYNKYMATFGPEEDDLRRKVEETLGTVLMILRQRISGLGTEWGGLAILGTKGLATSYIEQLSG